MTARDILGECERQGQIITVGRFEGTECLGRGKALVIYSILDPDIPYGPPNCGCAVMVEDCGFAEETSVPAGALVRFWDRANDGYVVSSSAHPDGREYRMPDMTPDELERELTDFNIREEFGSSDND